LADEAALKQLERRLVITVHLASEDPRFVDLRRDLLAKLERVVPNFEFQLAVARQAFMTAATDERYGEIELRYGTRSDVTHSTSASEILPMIYSLADREPSAATAGADYPGHPLEANGQAPLVLYLVGFPILIVAAWWLSRRPPRIVRFLGRAAR